MSVLLLQPAVLSRTGGRFGAIANGLMALGMYLRERGQEVHICHLNGYRGEIGEFVREKLNAYAPEAVGVNLTWHTHCSTALEMVAAVRRHSPDLPVFLGGYTASLFDEQILTWAAARAPAYLPTAIIRGDGEETFERYLRDHELPEVGVSYLGSTGQFIRRPLRTPAEALPRVRLPRPVTDFVDDWPQYLQRGGIRTSVPGIEGMVGHDIGKGEVDIYLGKGCRNNCVYCGGSRDAHRLLSGRKRVAFREPTDVVEDMVALVEAGAGRLYLDFDPDPSRSFYHEIFRGLSPLEADIMFSAWSGPLPGDLLDAMAGASSGVEVVISPDSGSERLRRELISRGHGKPPFYSNAELEAFFGELARRGMAGMCYFITGLPWETEQDREETIALGRRLAERYPGVFAKEYDARPDRNLAGPPLYLEPGSPIHLNPAEFGMQITRSSFADFEAASRETGDDVLGVFHERYPNEQAVLSQSRALTESVHGREEHG
ncbi:MAG: cobalamin B12-binding domain-containing protein [Candidatus Aenigmarchaeota archaeon]|nr:cobalamin B12-binding domain-containing protein [Candidatus Aenigmarchaeota archaeon]